MAFNGSGTFNLIAGNPVVTGTTISSTWANNTLSDIATGLSTTITKDGQTTPTANIPMGGFKLTGVGAATTDGDALRYENLKSLQDQLYTAFTTGGSATAYTLTTSPIVASITTNERYQVKFHAANTSTTPTLARDGLTAKSLKIYDPTGVKVDPIVGEFAINMLADVVYDGTDYVVFPSKTLVVGTAAQMQTGTSTTLVPSISAVQNGKNTLGSPILTTSGNAVQQTGIPAYAKRITIAVMGVSTNGTSQITLRLGSSLGFDATNYFGGVAFMLGTTTYEAATLATGFNFTSSGSAAQVYRGVLTLTLADASTNTWACAGCLGRTDTGAMQWVAGTKALAAALDRVQLTTVLGADTFDAGSISVMWE